MTALPSCFSAAVRISSAASWFFDGRSCESVQRLYQGRRGCVVFSAAGGSSCWPISGAILATVSQSSRAIASVALYIFAQLSHHVLEMQGLRLFAELVALHEQQACHGEQYFEFHVISLVVLDE